jgi:hypothetical protein
MPLSHSVLRRYTPPTCTLQIMAKSSPLSRWLGQSVLKDLQFELRFDDPRKPEDERVTIRGNAEDLEVLYDAVNSYVQDFLTLSAPQLPITLRTSTAATGAMPREDLSHRATGVNPSTSVGAQSSEEVPDESDALSSVHPPESDPKVIPFKPRTPLAEIYLQPRGLFAHDLFLGRLATAESGPTVDLSVLQLFDLATALDEYAAEGVALPNLNPLGWKQAPPAWASAAAVAVLAVGVTTAGIRFLNQPNSKQEAAAPTTAQQPSPTPQPSLLSQVPLAPTTPLPTPLPTPVIPPPLASSPILPPPSPVAVLPSPTLKASQGSDRPTLNINPSSTTNTPALPKLPSAGVVPSGGIAILPRPSSNPVITSSRSSSSSGASPVSPASSKKSPAERTAPSPLITPPPLPSLPSLDSLPSSPEVAQQVTPPSTTARDASASADLKPSGSTESANAGNTTLFDNIPQVAEVRSYFQKRWQPPSGLTQTLEYSLTLNSDGTIQRIIPLGKAAGDFIDRTDIPLPGEPFVSAIDGGRTPSIRLVLTPDGKVSTFLEQTDRPQTQKK